MAFSIVAAFGGDTIAFGLLASRNRPGGNIAGMSVFISDPQPFVRDSWPCNPHALQGSRSGLRTACHDLGCQAVPG
jgi:hypothetical protein